MRNTSKTLKLLIHSHEWTHTESSSPVMYAEKCTVCRRTREDFLSGPFNHWTITNVGDRVKLLASWRKPIGISYIIMVIIGSIGGYLVANYTSGIYRGLAIGMYMTTAVIMSSIFMHAMVADSEVTFTKHRFHS